MSFLHLSTLLFSSLLMHLTLIRAQCLPHQTLALMQFKLQALADPSHLASWNSSVDCCQWPGISCNLAGTHVTALELTGLSITAGAPSLSQLAKLKSLILHSNHFISSSTLTNLHQLPGLTHLNLSGSTYSHEVAPAISRIRSLITLDLSSEPSASRSGRIPQTTQFGTFSNSSFEGNEGLCGQPLSKECEEPGNSKEGSWLGDDDDHHWIWIAVEVGYVTGLGIVVFPLMFWRKWRRWYMMRVEIMLWRISLFLHMERWIYKDFYSGDDGELE